MEHAMNTKCMQREGWKHCSLKPEHRGQDFPGTEDFPEGWFKDGVMVSNSGKVYHGVEAGHVDFIEIGKAK